MSAIILGGAGWTLADYFSAAVNAMPGDPAGFTASLLCRVDSQTVASANRRPFGQRGTSNLGWNFTFTATNSACTFGAGGTNSATSPSSSIAATDIGKLSLFTGVWDAIAGSLRLYAKRAQVSTGSSLAGGFAPDTGVAPMIGRRGADSPSDGLTIFGVSYAVGIATLAQIQAQFDAVMATERMQPVPGLPGVLIDLTQDFAGGVVASTLTDRGAGGINFSRVGSPTLSSQFARAWTW